MVAASSRACSLSVVWMPTECPFAGDVEHVARYPHGVVEILGTIDREHQGQFFVGKGVLAGDDVLFDHEELRRLGIFGQAEDLRSDVRILCYDVAVEIAVDPQSGFNLGSLVGRTTPAASPPESSEGVVVDVVEDDHGVLGRARRRIVEDFRCRDFFCSVIEIGAGVDDDRNIAGTDADRHRAGLHGAFDVVLRTGDDNEVALVHQRLGHLLVDGSGKDLNQIFRMSTLAQFRAHQVDGSPCRGSTGR